MRGLIWALCFAPLAVKAAQEPGPSGLDPDLLRLARIKVVMSENLARLPNYTCLQTIERSRRDAARNKFLLVDALRLEVALVDGKEMFSWPGAGRFEDRNLADLVGGGTIGNGNFALHARSVFLGPFPTYTYVGEETLGGRRAHRYDYRVAHMNSGFRLKVNEREAIVGYHGSFLVDAATLDLVRLEVHADDIPPHLGLASASDTMYYRRVRIGQGDFLLPESSELVMVNLQGGESRNRTRFESCRQYTGESVLSFAEPDLSKYSWAPTAAPREVQLVSNLALDLLLETPIRSGDSAVGDPVRARLANDVKRKGQLILPKGALVTGRLTRLEKRSSHEDFFLVGVQFATIEFDNCRAGFPARLESVGPAFTSGRRISLEPPTTARQAVPPKSAAADGSGHFYVVSNRLELAKGMRMLWRTELNTDKVIP